MPVRYKCLLKCFSNLTICFCFRLKLIREYFDNQLSLDLPDHLCFSQILLWFSIYVALSMISHLGFWIKYKTITYLDYFGNHTNYHTCFVSVWFIITLNRLFTIKLPKNKNTNKDYCFRKTFLNLPLLHFFSECNDVIIVLNTDTNNDFYLSWSPVYFVII